MTCFPKTVRETPVADLKSKWVVRSMSTTDYTVGGPPVVPYHCYLQARRAGAWWTTFMMDVQVFDSPQEAEAEIDRCFKEDRYPTSRPQVAPYCDGSVPTFWDVQKLNGDFWRR